jgi:serine kinase of HPr protein (carbohydrate metabolism regulator)
VTREQKIVEYILSRQELNFAGKVKNNESEETMKIKNDIKAHIVGVGITMSEVLERLAKEYGWNTSISNFSGKLNRGSLRYGEAIKLAAVLGYEIVWQKRKST